VGGGPQQRWRVLCGAEPNVCGGDVRQADMLHGVQHTVGEELFYSVGCHIRLGWVRLWYVRFRYVRLG
jgi:hypothetical protein